MNKDLEAILAGLQARLNQTRDLMGIPYLYLDPEAVRHLFQNLTGLKEPPRVRVLDMEGQNRGRIELDLESGPGYEPPAQILFEAMAPAIEKKMPLIEQPDDLANMVHRYARVRGLLQATRFPDGNLNMEVAFLGLRGILFYTPAFFSSVIRPLLSDDRFHTLYCQVEAFVYVHGPVQKIIFYHQSYGDNLEHEWLPLAPVVLRETKDQNEFP